MAGRLRHRNIKYAPQGEVQTKFEKYTDDVLKNYDGLLSKNLAEANAWRLVGLIGVVCLAACIGILVYTLKQPKSELVVVSVNDIGETRYEGTTRGISFDKNGLQANVMYNIFSRFIKNTYTIGTDDDLMYENLRSNFYYLSANKREIYQKDINAIDPFSDIGSKTRNVRIETVMPVTENSWQVDFFIDTDDFTKGKSTSKMRAIFTVTQVSSEQYGRLTDNERHNNPLAIYITDYNIVKVE